MTKNGKWYLLGKESVEELFYSIYAIIYFSTISCVIYTIFAEITAVLELYSVYFNHDVSLFAAFKRSPVYESIDVLGCIRDALRFEPVDLPSDETRRLIRNYCWVHGIYPHHYYRSEYQGSEIYLKKPEQNASESFERHMALARLEREETHLYKAAFCKVSLLLFVQVILLVSRGGWKKRMYAFPGLLNFGLGTIVLLLAKKIMYGQYTLSSEEVGLFDSPHLFGEPQYLANDTDLFEELIKRTPFDNYVKLKDDLSPNGRYWIQKHGSKMNDMIIMWIIFYVFNLILQCIHTVNILVFYRDETRDDCSSIQNPVYEFDHKPDDKEKNGSTVTIV